MLRRCAITSLQSALFILLVAGHSRAQVVELSSDNLAKLNEITKAVVAEIPPNPADNTKLKSEWRARVQAAFDGYTFTRGSVSLLSTDDTGVMLVTPLYVYETAFEEALRKMSVLKT